MDLECSVNVLDLLFDHNDPIISDKLPQSHDLMDVNYCSETFNGLSTPTISVGPDEFLDSLLAELDNNQQPSSLSDNNCLFSALSSDSVLSGNCLVDTPLSETDTLTSPCRVDTGSSTSSEDNNNANLFYNSEHSLSPANRLGPAISPSCSDSGTSSDSHISVCSSRSPRGSSLSESSSITSAPINIAEVASECIFDEDTEDIQVQESTQPRFFLYPPANNKCRTAKNGNYRIIRPQVVGPRTKSTLNGRESKNPKKYPALSLTDEEKRLMKKEGVSLPTHYPLTKSEERELKRIRRKIRNKVSAQESRKRKQEYVDALEDRVEQCTQQNQQLKKTVDELGKQNRSLVTQLRKLQHTVNNGGKRTTQAGTCLAVLLLSCTLLVAPNYSPWHKSRTNETQNGQNTIDAESVRRAPMAGQSRTLLQHATTGPVFGPEELTEEELEAKVSFKPDIFLYEHQYAAPPDGRRAKHDIYNPPNGKKMKIEPPMGVLPERGSFGRIDLTEDEIKRMLNETNRKTRVVITNKKPGRKIKVEEL